MKLITLNLRNLRVAISLAIALGLANAAWSKPSIRSIVVSPNPITIAQNFTVTVAATPDVIYATASVDFRKGEPQFLEIPLTKQGSNWVGSATVPLELRFDEPHKPEARMKVLVLDSALRRDEQTIRLAVKVPSTTAVFAGGILTITGDNDDNTIVATRDGLGKILVNGGAVPVTGGAANVTNTTLIRILGLGGNDVLEVSDISGPMPPANLLGGDGNDTLTGSNNADELDGGAGNDSLFGRGGIDILIGGTGNDLLVGGLGQDQLLGGEGDDQFVWNPGDASDLVEGEYGEDTLLFNGAIIGENVDLSANGPRLRFFRNVANITMDCAGIEQVLFRALGGADQVVINDLTGTEVAHVGIDLSGAGGTGDLTSDSVFVNGTETNDVITVAGTTNGVIVLGLTAEVTIIGAEPSLDILTVNGLAGEDMVDASLLEANVIGLTLNGGLGADTLVGSQGNDLIVGGRDTDLLAGGPGDDTFPWNPGDGNDVVEGQTGHDTLLFNGAVVSEKINVSANGQRVRFTRDIANITMDCNEVETIQFNASGGSDEITVNDLSGTGVVNVNLDLHAPIGANTTDNTPDTVIVNGSTNDDSVVVVGSAAGVIVQGLSATVNIVGSEPTLDQLIIRLLAGNDIANAANLIDGLIKLIIDGGLGDDVLIGSAGADVLLGSEDDDVLLGGPGIDVLDGGTGNNIVIQD